MNLTYKDRCEKVMFLSQRLPYPVDWYKTRTDNQLLAMWYKEIRKDVQIGEPIHAKKKSDQLEFDFSGEYVKVKS